MLAEQLANELISAIGIIPYFVLANCIALIPPLFLGARIVILLNSRQMRVKSGVLYGFLLGIWSTACWLVVPYCGIYPNLPSLLIARLLIREDSLQLDVLVILQSIVIWTLIGGGIGFLGDIERSARR